MKSNHTIHSFCEETERLKEKRLLNLLKIPLLHKFIIKKKNKQLNNLMSPKSACSRDKYHIVYMCDGVKTNE